MNPSPQQLGLLLKQGQITPAQYQQGMNAFAPPPDPDYDPGAPSASQAGPEQSKTSTRSIADVIQGQPGHPIDVGPPTQSVTPVVPAAPAGAAQMQGQPAAAAAAPAQDPRDAALAAFISPRAAAAGQRVGLSPADKADLQRQQERKDEIVNQTGQLVENNKTAVDAFGQQSDALQTESQVAAAAFQQQAQHDAERRASLETETKQRQQQIDDRLNRLDAEGVNPNHYWQSLGTGGQIGAAIAIGLGTFGAGLNHGPNTALEIINGAINRDVDAQKVNLQKSLDVLRQRGQLDSQGFDHQVAMLNAERDSYQTAYSIATNDISKRMGMYKDNADFQQHGAAMNQALLAEKDQKTAAINDRIYSLQKGSERVVAGAGNGPQAAIIKRAQELADKAHEGGRELSPADARRIATSEIMGVDVKSGEPMPELSKVPPGGANGKVSPRLKGQIADLSEGTSAADALLKSGIGGAGVHPMGGSEKAGLTLQTAAFNKALRTVLGEEEGKRYEIGDPGVANIHFTDADRAKLLMGRQKMQARLQSLQAGGGGGSDPESLGLELDE